MAAAGLVLAAAAAAVAVPAAAGSVPVVVAAAAAVAVAVAVAAAVRLGAVVVLLPAADVGWAQAVARAAAANGPLECWGPLRGRRRAAGVGASVSLARMGTTSG